MTFSKYSLEEYIIFCPHSHSPGDKFHQKSNQTILLLYWIRHKIHIPKHFKQWQSLNCKLPIGFKTKTLEQNKEIKINNHQNHAGQTWHQQSKTENLRYPYLSYFYLNLYSSFYDSVNLEIFFEISNKWSQIKGFRIWLI